MESFALQRWRQSLQKDPHQLAEKESGDLERLQGRVLDKLATDDFQHILDISRSFRDCGAPPTTYGKALHFFLSETVMLWDQTIVRNTYKLRPDPERFVSYFEPMTMILDHLAFSLKLSARAVAALGGRSKASPAIFLCECPST